MSETLQRIFSLRTISVDVAILAGIYCIPASSHLAHLHIFQFNLMRIFMLVGCLFARQNQMIFSYPIAQSS